jgi:hypothetical protein
MELQILSKLHFKVLFRFYFGSLVGGLIFAALIVVLKSNYQIAQIVATIFGATGALYVSYIAGLILISKGMAQWRVNSCMLLSTITPGVFLYISPILCFIFFVIGFPLGAYVLFCEKNGAIAS